MGTMSENAVQHGFPHLPTVRRSINALYRRISADAVRSYGTSVPAFSAVDLQAEGELVLGVQSVARSLVRHLRLPDARVIVSFREMTHAGEVELAAGPEYFVDLNARFRDHQEDIAAVLAHEITHVYLHRLDLTFPGTRDNEILTDTAAAYLGVGWLLLDAYRESSLYRQKLGYLTPEEYGYVLAKRAEVFDEDPSPWFTSAQAYDAYVAGRAEAGRDRRRPPLAGGGWAERWRYTKDRRQARELLRGAPAGATASAPNDADSYAFEGGSRLRVSFPCPVCRQRIRVPAGGRLRARCGVCHTVLDCDA